MRIIAGTFRGMTLASVGKGDPAAHLRPTSDRVRESIFNILLGGNFGDPVTGARVLDLFAGTGALGLEALSRGAVHATFVDDGVKAGALLRENIARTRTSGATRILRRDAAQLGPAPEAAFTLVFLDPPYGRDLGQRALVSAQGAGWIAPGAVVVWEENAPQIPPEGFVLREHRRYGDTCLTFVEALP